MAAKLSHICSLRIPQEHHSWVQAFANHYQVKPAYIYRAAINDFIKKRKSTAA